MRTLVNLLAAALVAGVPVLTATSSGKPATNAQLWLWCAGASALGLGLAYGAIALDRPMALLGVCMAVFAAWLVYVVRLLRRREQPA